MCSDRRTRGGTRTMTKAPRLRIAIAGMLVAGSLAACSADDADPTPAASGTATGTITIYSGREEEFVNLSSMRSHRPPGSRPTSATGTPPSLPPRSPRRATPPPPTSSSPRTPVRLGAVADAGPARPDRRGGARPGRGTLRHRTTAPGGNSGRGRVARVQHRRWSERGAPALHPRPDRPRMEGPAPGRRRRTPPSRRTSQR